MHALIIENEYFVVESVEDTLGKLGYTSFDDANSVAAAIEAAERRNPDLIIANHQLVDGTGTDAVLAICNGKGIPVVFVTAIASTIRERLPGALIVAKPYSEPKLMEAVEEARRNP